jgi:hypothetical protein
MSLSLNAAYKPANRQTISPFAWQNGNAVPHGQAIVVKFEDQDRSWQDRIHVKSSLVGFDSGVEE